jgi:cysteinyl-tRNA synthetase
MTMAVCTTWTKSSSPSRPVPPPVRELRLAPAEVDRLLGERDDARRQGDFTTADEIRGMLERLGIEVRDTPEGTSWKLRRAVTARKASEGDAP